MPRLQVSMLAAAITLLPMTARAAEAPAAHAVLATYGALAEAMYGDALSQARALDGAIAALLASPGEPMLQAAREAWKAARSLMKRRKTRVIPGWCLRPMTHRRKKRSQALPA